MKKEVETKQAKPCLTAVRLSKDLYEKLELKSEEMGDIGVSETIRILLSWSLENPQLDFLNPAKERAQVEIGSKIQNKILQHVVTSYYLLKDQIVSTGEEGLRRNKIAHEKGEKAIVKILEQHSIT